KHIVPNWVIAVPDPNVTIGKKCNPFKVEMVIRGYLSGHAWREYKSGKRTICGIPMPEGMKENDKFPEPIITPTSKAEEGHDLDLSREEIIEKGLVIKEKYEQLEDYTRKLFDFGSKYAKSRGLILVDTKYEFGEVDEILRIGTTTIYLIDEVHTPDSSRYFYAEGYEDRQQKGEPQKQLSKEFVREWLIENNFMGKEGQAVPEMDDQWLSTISDRYIELYEKVTGKKFEKPEIENVMERIENNVELALKNL
ncbi:MAG: phosphoribosylaminoimidazolesuccinocarboxamide synthase, partial [Chitinophagales bacterium]